jgi:hypothetical protein
MPTEGGERQDNCGGVSASRPTDVGEGYGGPVGCQYSIVPAGVGVSAS